MLVNMYKSRTQGWIFLPVLRPWGNTRGPNTHFKKHRTSFSTVFRTLARIFAAPPVKTSFLKHTGMACISHVKRYKVAFFYFYLCLKKSNIFWDNFQEELPGYWLDIKALCVYYLEGKNQMLKRLLSYYKSSIIKLSIVIKRLRPAYTVACKSLTPHTKEYENWMLKPVRLQQNVVVLR